MQTKRPQPKSTIRIVVTDVDANKSQTKTVYDTTVDETMRVINEAIEAAGRSHSRSESQNAHAKPTNS